MVMGFGRVGVGSKGRLGIVGQDLNLRPSGYEPDCDGILCIRGDDGRPPPLRRGRAGADHQVLCGERENRYGNSMPRMVK